jgi:hypothetical protein
MKFRTGGQTGVDRAVLDFCLENQEEVGGWCPAGRKAEDGTIPTHYPLDELEGVSYGERTEANVRDSDGTLILHLGNISGGTQLTVECCRKLGKPSLSLNLKSVDKEAQAEELLEFMESEKIRELNVAGPRASEESEAYVKTRAFLHLFLSALRKRE